MEEKHYLVPVEDLIKLTACPDALLVYSHLLGECRPDGPTTLSERDIAASLGITRYRVRQALVFLTSINWLKYWLKNDENRIISTKFSTNKKGGKVTTITLCNTLCYEDCLKSQLEVASTSFSTGRSIGRKPSENETPNTQDTVLDIKKDSKKRTTKSSLSLPYESEKFVSTWNELLQEPKWKGKSVHALSLNLKDLAKYEEGFAIYLMERAIKNGTQGIVYDWTPREYQNWKMTSTDTLNKNTQLAPYQGGIYPQGNTVQRAVPGQNPVRKSKVEQNMEANREAFAIIDSLIPDTDSNNDNTQEPDEQ